MRKKELLTTLKEIRQGRWKGGGALVPFLGPGHLLWFRRMEAGSPFFQK